MECGTYTIAEEAEVVVMLTCSSSPSFTGFFFFFHPSQPVLSLEVAGC